jgi:hypothetical protein
MIRVSRVLASFAFLSIVSFSGSAQQFGPRAGTVTPASTITTLYAADPIAHSLCFTDGREGGSIQQGGVFNRCSHIEFDNYKAGSLSVAIEGGEVGHIIDLGTAKELSKLYGYEETVGSGQGFASIESRDGKVLITKERYKPERQELTQAAQLFEPGVSTASAEAKTGHIYLARITDSHDENIRILVKLLVLSVKPGESVTFRWAVL